MGFNEDKNKALKKFNQAVREGKVDKPIMPLLTFINSLNNFYTTSSCSGRVILLHEYGRRKIDNEFVLKEHDKADFEDFLNVEVEDLKGRIWLKEEPFIIHIVARNLDNAKDILEIAIKSGLKHSGIFVFKPSRHIVEINGTQIMAVPIIDNQKLLISKDYYLYLLKLCNLKLQKNTETREKFEKAMREKYVR